MMRQLPHPRATILMSFLLILIVAGLTIYSIERGVVSQETAGMMLGNWMTIVVALGSFWFGTSVGGRMGSNSNPVENKHVDDTGISRDEDKGA